MNTVLLITIIAIAVYKIGRGIHGYVLKIGKEQEQLEQSFENPLTLDLARHAGKCFAVLETAPDKIRICRCRSTFGYSAVYDASIGRHYSVQWNMLHQLFLTSCECFVGRMAPAGPDFWIKAIPTLGHLRTYAIIKIESLGDGTIVPVVLDPKKECVLTLAIEAESKPNTSEVCAA